MRFNEPLSRQLGEAGIELRDARESPRLDGRDRWDG
jgi:hypothetical protein